MEFTYQAKTFLYIESTCTDNIGRQFFTPSLLTDSPVDNRHIHRSKFIGPNQGFSGAAGAPSGYKTRRNVFDSLGPLVWKINWFNCDGS